MRKKTLIRFAIMVVVCGVLAYTAAVVGSTRAQASRNRELIAAVQNNDLSATRRLLGAGANPNGRVGCYTIFRAPNIIWRIRWAIFGRGTEFEIPLLTYAKDRVNPDIVELLRSSGGTE